MNRKTFGCAAAALMLTIFGCAPENVGSPNMSLNASGQKVPILAPFRAKNEDLCVFDSVQVSPAGRFAVFDRGSRRQTSLVSGGVDIGVVDMACRVSGGALGDCITVFKGLDGIRALSWTADEQSLYAVENGTHLIRIEFDKTQGGAPARVVERVLVNREIADTVVSLGTASSNAAASEIASLERARIAAMKSAKRTDVPDGVYVDATRGVGAVVFDPALGLVMLGKDSRTELHLRTPEAVLPRVTFRQRAGATVQIFADVGIEIESGTPAMVLPFSKAIIAAGDGSLIGRFNRRDIQVDPASSFDLHRLRQHIAGALEAAPEFFIQDISAANEKDFAYTLKNVQGRRKFGFSYKGNLLQHECADSMPRHAEVDPKVVVSDVSLGTSARPLFGILASPLAPRGLAVVFGGGPAGHILNRMEYFAALQHFLGMGLEVLAVSYSGSLGSGFETTARVRSEGAGAVVEDAEAVAQYIRNRHADQPIVIYGESFGALPATSLAALLPGKPLVLVAPFLVHQQPQLWVHKEAGPFNRITVRSQERVEKALLNIHGGDDAALQRDMRGILDSRPTVTPTLVVFAKQDPLSQPAHLPAAWKSNVSQEIVQGGHQFITTQPAVWPAIKAWMAVSMSSGDIGPDARATR